MTEIRINVDDNNAAGMALAAFLLVNRLMGVLEKKGVLTAEESERLLRDCEEIAGDLSASAESEAKQAMADAAAVILQVTAAAFDQDPV